MNLKEKRVLVMGTGRSGAAAAKLLKEKGCPIRIYDEDRESRRIFPLSAACVTGAP